MTSQTLIGTSADEWLSTVTAVATAEEIRWSGSSPTSDSVVGGVEHLSVLISRLTDGDWGVVEWASGASRRWGQTRRHGHGWIVEVHEGSHDGYVKRVYRGERGDYPPPSGLRPAYPFELWTSGGAADVLWDWLHGRHVDGCWLTTRHRIDDGRDHSGC